MSAIAGITEWLSGTFSDPSTIASAVAAGGSAAFALVSWVSEQRTKGEAEATKRRIEVLQQEGLRASLDAQVIAWGTRAIDVLAEAQRISSTRSQAASPTALDTARDTVVSRISALVDQGRLFFPNVSHDLVGLDRPFANRGFRPPILDALMLAFEWARRIEASATDDEVRAQTSALFGARRAFVSELQRALDPRRRQVIFENLADSRKVELRGDDVVWDSVHDLVADFEQAHGDGSFWQQRPKPRRELLDEPGSPH